MKNFTIGMLSSLFLLPVAAYGGEMVDQTLTAESNGFVKVNVVRGEVRIEGWDKNSVQVVGELDEKTEKFIFEVNGNETIISVRIPNRNKDWCCNDGSDLRIKVPNGSRLDVGVVSTEVRVEDIQGGLEVGGVSGAIKLDDVSGRIRVTNVSGEIEANGLSGRTRLKTVSGDIDVENAQGIGVYHSVSGNLTLGNAGDDLDLETVSGDIEVDSTSVNAARGHTVSGDIDLQVVLGNKAIIDFDTVSGSVRLRLDGNLSARYRLETASGSIRNRLTNHEPKHSKYIRDESLRFVKGDGDGEVRVSTRSGDIVLGGN